MSSNNPNVGIDDLQFTIDDLRIYPNPTTGQLTINNEQLTINNIEVYDIMGRLLMSQIQNPMSQIQNPMSQIQNPMSQIQIDISHFSAGVYFVKIRTEAGEVVKKVVKE